MLTALKIKRFRALEDFTVHKLGQVNLIVGKNNSGKSSVLEALQLYAGNADIRLLETLANGHGEPSRFREDITEPFEDDVPFASFFSGRQFPIDDEGIEIGDPHLNDYLTIQHGYQTEWEESFLNEESEAVSRRRFRRVLKSEISQAIDEPLFDTLFIKKGDIQYNYRLVGGLLPRSRITGMFVSSNQVPCAVVPTQFIDVDELADVWDKIALTDNQEIVKDALKIIAPDFVDISFVRSDDARRYTGNSRRPLTRTAKVRLQKQNQPVPLGSMGDGMLRVLQLVLKIFSARGGFLLIDEFENGLHYSVQEKVWGLIFDLAEQLDIQVFATTHSWDCIESFAKVALDKSKIEGVLFRVGRSARTSDQGKVIATVFDEAQLFNITQADVEVR